MVNTQALNGLRLGPAERMKPSTSAINSARPRTTPPKQRPWPSRYLVAEWMTISAPQSRGRCRAGVQKQLSTASRTPRLRARSASAARSPISHSGLDGVSSSSSLVLGPIASRQASMSVKSTKVVATPNLARNLLSKTVVVPNTLREHTRWSPARSRAMQVLSIAAMPEAVATACSAPSRAAMRASKVRTLGLV